MPSRVGRARETLLRSSRRRLLRLVTSPAIFANHASIPRGAPRRVLSVRIREYWRALRARRRGTIRAALDLVNRAVARRAQQLADTGLADYRATAHGYVTFLAQLGEGFPTPPKIIKADELELEVYWHAPNQSKQRIIGRRDTLLLPTDIAYHRDHLGDRSEQFSAASSGSATATRCATCRTRCRRPDSALYDFALADSFAIGSGSAAHPRLRAEGPAEGRSQPRVVGAIYIDPGEAPTSFA